MREFFHHERFLLLLSAFNILVAEVYTDQFIASWQDITNIRKPIIAAVSGYAVRFPPFQLSVTTDT